MKIHKGDQVQVMTGREQDRGKRGRVKQVFPRQNRIIVEGVHFVKRHRRPRGQMDQARLQDLAGGRFGFGAPIPFPVQNEPPKIDIPVDPLEFARASAGFWHTTMSPLAGALIAQTVANRGVTLEPRIVQGVYKESEKLWEETRGPAVLRRAVKPETAGELTARLAGVFSPMPPSTFTKRSRSSVLRIASTGVPRTLQPVFL